jgi:hypothetical protein
MQEWAEPPTRAGARVMLVHLDTLAAARGGVSLLL